MSLDFAPDNIRVVSVNPGAIDTPMVRNAIEGTGGDLEDELISTGQAHPLGRIGQPEDIANMVLFLASDRASFVTGSYFNVDNLKILPTWSCSWRATGRRS
jgi:NAD(P)-dependent dehydrogenase (short-subunit alcohol dehydrogenase family)